MIVTILSIVLFLIFTFLGAIHFYWIFGGRWGLSKAIPTKSNQANTRPIPKFATLIVALVLLTFGLVYLLKSGWIHIQVPTAVLKFAYWFIPIIFIIRAFGEFKYVGLFKKIKDTEFAKADTNIFVPLCLCIGLAGLLIQLMNK